MDEENVIYTYRLSDTGEKDSYDEALVVACLQGIINRNAPQVYVTSQRNNRPQAWLDLFTSKGKWLYGRTLKTLTDLDVLVDLAGVDLKGAVIWDPEVPATLNVANTIAGVEDGVVLNPESAEEHLDRWELKVLKDLRELFAGSESGSAKNDAYRWATQEYLAKGLCSSHLICLYEDAFTVREKGNIRYVVTRDWAVKNRAFVFDLSPWGDEKPADDPEQPLGTDLETYKLILGETLRQSAGEHMTELAGFFSFSKYSNTSEHQSKHDPVPTEWETVYLISPYNCYQNTVAHDCYNQSFHSHYPFTPLRQHRPRSKPQLEKKIYICFHMCDYDSTTPLYDFLPDFWDDEHRGDIPLAWGINPNLIETYPDIITYYYETATENDYFVGDASAAGYFNPNRIQQRYIPLLVKHNKRFFELTDMSIAPMVLDWDEPTAAVKDAFAQFSPDGYATIVHDFHDQKGKPPKPHIWKGMPILEMLNTACNAKDPKLAAELIYESIREQRLHAPCFRYVRIVWVSPNYIVKTLESLRRDHPGLDFVAVDPYTFFNLFKQLCAQP